MIKRQVSFFALNGLIMVAIAYTIYLGLVSGGHRIEIAAAVAYISGMAYGFFANKYLSFGHRGVASRVAILRYILLYAGTLVVNVIANSVMLDLVQGLTFGLFISFLTAIGISTVLNFAGLKYWVFPQSGEMALGVCSVKRMKS